MPVIDQVASDYQDGVRFIAVAGNRSSYENAAARVGVWFSEENLSWGLDDSIWALYGVGYQPTVVLITGNDVIVDGWLGPVGEEDLRAALDRLVALGA